MGPPRLTEWQEDASREVLVALYLRDALGVVDPSGVPALRGTALPPVPAPPDPISWWWMRWWVSVVDRRGWGLPLDLVDDDGVVALPMHGAEQFTALVKHHLDDARTYAQVMRDVIEVGLIERAGGRHVVSEEVAALVASLGRPPRSSALRIEILPVVERGVWWIGDEVIAVSDELHADPDAFRVAIRPFLEQVI